MRDLYTPQQERVHDAHAQALFEAELKETVFGRQGMPLADDLLLVALNYRPGRTYGAPVLEPVALSLGLSGALLCELLLAEAVAVRGDVLVAAACPDLPVGLLTELREVVVSEPAHRLPDWLRWLGEKATGMVTDRMLRPAPVKRWADPVGPLLASVHKKLLGGYRYVPADYTIASWRAHRLAKMLTTRAAASGADFALLNLVTAVGLSDHVLRMTDVDVAGYQAHVERQLQARPALAAVVSAVGQLVNERALSGRD